MRLAVVLMVAMAPAVPAQATTSAKPGKTSPTQRVAVKKASPPKPAVKKPTSTFSRSTLAGVYTVAEARAGRDEYAGLCANCHTAESHTGPAFRQKWAGRPLSDLFWYMRTMMPKNEPASLADEDYQVLLAYILQLNKMPAGKSPLSTDSLVLAKIRIDTLRTTRSKRELEQENEDGSNSSSRSSSRRLRAP